MIFTLIIGLVIAVAALIFAFQNNVLIEVSFLTWNIESSLSLVIIASLLIGFIVAFVLMTQIAFKSGLKVKALKKKVSDLESDNLDMGIQYESEGLGEDSKKID